MEQVVFVFGTLKEGFPNSAVNRGSRVPGTFRTRVAYPLLLVGERHSPWLVDSPGNGFQVAGQVFKVDAATLAAMDILERISDPDGYRRCVLELESLESSGALCAYAYLKPAEQVVQTEVRMGPLEEYGHEHAALYRPRA